MGRCIACDKAAAEGRRAARKKVISNATIWAKNNGQTLVAVYRTESGKYGYCSGTDARIKSFASVEYISVSG